MSLFNTTKYYILSPYSLQMLHFNAVLSFKIESNPQKWNLKHSADRNLRTEGSKEGRNNKGKKEEA